MSNTIFMCLFVVLTSRLRLRIAHQVAHDKDPSTNCTHLFIILLKITGHSAVLLIGLKKLNIKNIEVIKNI